MRRTRVKICLGVVLRPLVFILHKESDRRPECYSVFNPRLKANKIFFVSLEKIGYQSALD